jgi:ubiquinone/menaquinone biosynthesis C-methylase UbiE
MLLTSGIPRIAWVDELQRQDLYRRHTDFNRDFLSAHGQALAKYGRHWGQDPFKLWSRRWEYPYVAQRILEFAESQPNDARMRVIDAGSGVTYFPYFICDKVPNAEVTCVDSDPSYPPMFDAINRNVGHRRVSFMEAMLQKLPLDNGAADVIACISVLEHTSNYGEIIREFARVLRPGGLLVLTFDLSLDGKFELSRDVASDLLKNVSELFTVDKIDPQQELSAMEKTSEILTTEHVKNTQPDLLPWKYPMVKAVHDLVNGKGWTGGFRSKSIFCVSGRKK